MRSSDALDRIEAESFVETPHAIALEIDGDVLIADGTNLAHDAAADLGLECARKFVCGDLEPREH